MLFKKRPNHRKRKQAWRKKRDAADAAAAAPTATVDGQDVTDSENDAAAEAVSDDNVDNVDNEKTDSAAISNSDAVEGKFMTPHDIDIACEEKIRCKMIVEIILCFRDCCLGLIIC